MTEFKVLTFSFYLAISWCTSGETCYSVSFSQRNNDLTKSKLFFYVLISLFSFPRLSLACSWPWLSIVMLGYKKYPIHIVSNVLVVNHSVSSTELKSSWLQSKMHARFLLRDLFKKMLQSHFVQLWDPLRSVSGLSGVKYCWFTSSRLHACIRPGHTHKR